MKPPYERFVQVESAGVLTTVQDRGRTGGRRYGMSVCGALEGDHLRLANAAVGNWPGAAALELSGGEVWLELDRPTWACWIGHGKASLERGKPELIHTFEATGRGLLALGGGIDVPEIQGSRSTDVRSGFGGFKGHALRRGDVLPLGARVPDPRADSPRWRIPTFSLEGAIRVVRGPEWNWLTPASQRRLETLVFRVSVQSNRMGLRLEAQKGQTLEHDPSTQTHSEQMRSGAVLPGVVQLPLNGQPIVLLQDAGTMGGYPRVLIVSAVDLPRLAVLTPGTAVYLRLISNEEALSALIERERELEILLKSIALRRSGWVMSSE